jgi:hypothetical protein
MLPREAFNIQIPLDTVMGDITLVGYDFYKAGHRSTPATPLHNGDPVELVLYWQPNQPNADIPPEIFIQVITHSGTPVIAFSVPLTKIDPDEKWSTGEIIRQQQSFFLTKIGSGNYRLAFSLDYEDEPVLSQPFYVE